MDINRNNYEAYFLDFAEGNLSPEQEEILHRFLKFNPDLAKELSTFSMLTVSPGKTPYPAKSSLKKEFPKDEDDVSQDNFDFYCIAYLEGDLSKEQNAKFEKFLKDNPYFKKNLAIYNSTIIPASKLTYPNKKNLYHKASIKVDWRIFVPLAAAAAIALLVIVGPTVESETLEIAAREELVKKPDNIKEIVKEKKENLNSVPASLNVIRTKTTPVPTSNYSKQNESKSENTNNSLKENNAQRENPVRFSKLDLDNQTASGGAISYDKIQARAIKSPEINPGSLSLLELARFQIQKASYVIEEEDDLLWNLASSGIKELNKFSSGRESQLLASRDENGEISGLRFQSRYLNVTAPISRNE